VREGAGLRVGQVGKEEHSWCPYLMVRGCVFGEEVDRPLEVGKEGNQILGRCSIPAGKAKIPFHSVD
jgi:hypothetical protein